MLRNFPTHVEDLARRCFDEPIVSEAFLTQGPIEGNATTSRRVVMSESQLTAWAKPAIKGGDARIIGHEKIASDLAFKLGLPVAPVQIVRGHGNADFSDLVCVSYAATGQPRPWTEQLALTDKQKEYLVPVLGAMYAFSAWLCDTDHNWNPGNALIELHDEDCCTPVFIDYSCSLQLTWLPPAKPTIAIGPKNGPNNLASDEAIRDGVRLLESLEIDDLRRIISRVPEECVALEKRENLISGLAERRAEIGTILGVS